jgi:hypothetical protein
MTFPMAIRCGTHEQARTRFSSSQAFAKIACHSAAIMGDQNPILLGCDFQEDWVFNASETSLLGIEDINSWFARS